MSIFKPILQGIRSFMNQKREAGGQGSTAIMGWDALDEALRVLEENDEVLSGLEEEQFLRFLKLAGANKTLDEKALAIRQMTAREIIEDMEKSTAKVAAAWEAAKVRQGELLRVAQELGLVGARLVLAFL